MLPNVLPIFPLHGVLLLPGGRLPLNIFEPRYIAMCDAALRSDRLIGMVQPRVQGEAALYTVGCAGKITAFTETEDGRYEIALSGISRFTLDKELPLHDGYRSVTPKWSHFSRDNEERQSCLGLDRPALKALLSQYFDAKGMDCDWDAIDNAPDGKLMTCLSMTCPFEPAEKQALLEEVCCKKRARMFMTLLEMEVRTEYSA